MNEEILSTENIFDGRIVHLKVHRVKLPDGSESVREVMEHPGAAAILAVDDEDMVLMVKQYRSGSKQIMYEIPAGLLEVDEDPRETAIRELREETGYRPLEIEPFGGVFNAPGYTNEYVHLFFARGYVHDPLEQDVDEFVEAVRMPLAGAIQMVENGEIEDSKTVIALLRLAVRRNS